jgi:TRAP-type C4-dicarboxylate transport system permease small subunit
MKPLRHLEEILGSLLLLAVCGITLFNVISRYLFNNPLSWAEEAASTLFVWLVMLGAALALKDRQHFAVRIVVDRLPPGLRSTGLRFGHLCVLAASLIVFVYGLVYASWGLEAVTPAMEIPRVWAYAAVPTGGLLLSLRAWQNLIQDWHAPESREEVGA